MHASKHFQQNIYIIVKTTAVATFIQNCTRSKRLRLKTQKSLTPRSKTKQNQAAAGTLISEPNSKLNFWRLPASPRARSPPALTVVSSSTHGVLSAFCCLPLCVVHPRGCRPKSAPPPSPPSRALTSPSAAGGTTRAQWEDVTGSTPLTFVNDCVSFTTTVSARFWLMDCRNIGEATRMATELYKEAIHVPFMAK